jgi:ribonuclease P protein component
MVVETPSTSVVPEVGVVAGKKVGNAVKRNRAKRRLREAAHRAPLRNNTAYVLVASEAVVDVAFDDLVEWVTGAVSNEKGSL